MFNFKKIGMLFSAFLVAAVLMVGSISVGHAANAVDDVNNFIPDFFKELFMDETNSISINAEDPTEPAKTPEVKETPEGQEAGQEHNKKVDESLSKKGDSMKDGTNTLDLVVILDKSGSMYGLEKDTIGGFNSMVEEQRKKEIPVKVTLLTFNQKSYVLYERKPLESVEPLTDKEYVAQGSTALLDAVGNALSTLKADESVNTEGNKVLVVITTDGYENASKEWTWNKVRELIKELEKDKGYQFVFLGADINAGDVAESMGINRDASMKFRKTSGVDGGVRANFKAMNLMMDSVAAGESVAQSASWKSQVIADR